MSKYVFEKLGPARFEQLAQTLLEKLFRTGGGLIQFGDGADGAREATWSQAAGHESYIRPKNESTDVEKQWVFQAKFHDIGQRGWELARADIESDLNKELEKNVNKYEVPCHKYILVTNVPFSGVRHVGTRDKVNAVIESWRSKIPEIEVWDATDLSRMLDSDPGTRTTFLSEILPGDILRELLTNLRRSQEARVNSYRAYLKSLLQSEGEARAEEAGDEGGLKLEKVFVDLDLSLNQNTANDTALPFVQQVNEEEHLRQVADELKRETHIPHSLDCVPASFALLRASYKSLLLKGGPGVGKSTLTQFLSLYHSARLVDPLLARRLANRLKLSGGVTAETLDAHCEVRFPLRIELRRYAKWIGERQRKEENPHFAAYFAENINKESSSTLDMEDIFTLTAKNPVLLLLDGLDEVPQPTTRDVIFRELQIFLNRCESEDCDVNVVLSSRPQGYRGEFDGFDPLEWQVVDLSQDDFNDYSDRWLTERIANIEERSDARQRVTDGMSSYAVRLMAKTLLQATVMLTIAKRKHAIPHAKHKLYEKFVEVIFEREQNKQPIIHEKADELKRLHEKVGFELISKLEKQDGAQTLEGAEFQHCVERVILDYGRGPRDGESSKSVVNDIVTLAKDRLCLLAGKGEKQEDIDFVIQPFREYFAAAYLARHEDADPDRAYDALSRRQHIWANVLQFYAAFQTTAQQRNWITEADGSEELQPVLEYMVEMIRRRRSLLKILPEFERPRNEYVRRAFKNLMEKTTLWTWRDRESTAELLDAFSHNEAHYNLKSCFTELSTNDEKHLFVEVDLLVKTDRTQGRTDASTLLSNLAKEKHTRAIALEVARLNEVPVKVDSLNITEIIEHFPSRYTGGRLRHRGFPLENWIDLSDGTLVDLAVSDRFHWAHFEIFNTKWVNDLFEILNGNNRLFELGGVAWVFPLYFFERPVADSIAEIRDKVASLECCFSSRYIVALLEAIQNPTEYSLYQSAVNESVALNEKFKVNPQFDVERQLGPPLCQFESIEKWVSARKSVFSAESNELGDWIASLEGHSWMVLFIPEAGWGFLDPLVHEQELRRLWGEVFSRLRLMAAGSPSIASIEMMRYDQTFKNISLVFKTLVKISQEIGAGFLENSHFIRMHVHPGGKVPENLEGSLVLEDVENKKLPPEFCSAIVGMLLGSKGIDLNRLVSFWKIESKSDFVLVHGDIDKHMADLLAMKNPDAVILAASLIDLSHHRRTLPQVRSQVAEQYCELLVNSPVLTKNDFRRLLSLPAHIREIELWCRQEAIQAFQELGWGLERFRERLFELINSTTLEHERIREVMYKIVEDRNDYAVEIGLGAIDAIHRLDELNSSPLEDQDWQVSGS